MRWWALAGLVAMASVGCKSDESVTPGIVDGSIIPGSDAPAARPDAHVFDGRIVDARIVDARPIFDGPPGDAFSGDRFDVAYVSEWNLNSSTAPFQADQLAVFINTGTTPLAMSSLTIVSIMLDRNDTEFIWRVSSADSSTMRQGTAHGGIQNTHVIDLVTPLVPEDIVTGVPEITGGFTAHAGGSYTMHPKVMVQIGEATATLDFVIHVTGNGGDPVEFLKAKRVSSALPPDAGP